MNPFKFILGALRSAGVFGLYMDSGGSSAPSETTQKTDLPDWAKPYAQETLEKTKQLTSAPYQAYNAPRIAGFSPLQEQSFAGAQQLGPSQLGMFGGQLAGAASLGALGTQYRPFQHTHRDDGDHGRQRVPEAAHRRLRSRLLRSRPSQPIPLVTAL